MKIYKALFFVLLCNCVFAQQERRFRHISSEDGLSNSTVESVLQDSRGFMWFGTGDGLNRYDGYQMITYKYQVNDSTSISNNYIHHIFEDKQKRLWISVSNGINRYNRELDAFYRYDYPPIESLKPNNNPYINYFVYEDRRGRIWAGTPAGLCLYNEVADRFERYLLNVNGKKEAFNANVSCLFEDGTGILWMGTSNDGIYWRDRSGIVHHCKHDPDDLRSLSSNNISAIAGDPYGNLWIGTVGGGLNLKKSGIQHFSCFLNSETDATSLSGNVIKCIGIDRTGNVWVGTENGGLNLLNPTDQSFIRYENDPLNPFSLSQKTVSAFFEDRQGNIWIGTHRGGVNLHIPKFGKFNLYTQTVNNRGLSYKDVKTFYEDKQGTIYVGTDGGGLNVWNRAKQTFQYYRYHPNDVTSIGSDAILHIMADHDGDIWIGTWGGGLNHFDPATGKFKRFMHSPDDTSSISSNNVWRILEDSRGQLWVATSSGGLCLFNKQNGTFHRVGNGTTVETRLLSDNILMLMEDEQKNLWVGTGDGGLSYYDISNQRFTHYFVRILAGGIHPPTEGVRTIFKDSKNRLWVGQKGLHLFNPHSRTFSTAQRPVDLKDMTIQGIQEDDTGNFWISTTSSGLIRYNPDTGDYKQFVTADGLQGLEFGPNATLKTAKGELIFGGNSGFNIFHPDSIVLNTTVPPVYLTDFQLSNITVRPAEHGSPLTHYITEAREITLNYKQSVFSIEFTALNYIATERNQYAYKMEGFDENWHHTDQLRKATYTNLNPGHYTFRVKASNNDGSWNETGASIGITIHPPFWKTWWFRALLSLTILSIASFYLWLYRKLEIRKLDERKKEEIHQMQLQFFTNISHEFRTPLSLISGALEKLKDSAFAAPAQKYLHLMEKNTLRLTSLISELMDFRKLEAGMIKLKVKQINVKDILQSITDDFNTIAETKGIHFSTDAGEPEISVYHDPKIVEKIILNLLNNAFKYTDTGGFISIKIAGSQAEILPRGELINVVKSKYESSRYLYIAVSDSGIGISPSSAHHLFERYYRMTGAPAGSGIGLAFVKNLTLLHKGFIKVYSEIDKGTDIVVGLPCDERDYAIYEKLDADTVTADPDAQLEHILQDTTEFKNWPAPEGKNGMSDLTKDKYVLVVDDHHDLRVFIKEYLASYYRVDGAADGAAALEAIQREMPDLIICDLMMPRMDGLELCRQIKETPLYSHIPFIMLTAKDAPEFRLEGISNGADVYFTKPVNFKLLYLTIENIFRQQQQLKLHYLKDYQTEIRETLHAAKDRTFMDNLLHLLEGALEDPELNVDYFCQRLGMSQTKFYKRLKEITGKSITEFIRTVRMKKAAHILTHEDVNVSEVMHRVGIQSPSYFTSTFKKEFGVTPSQYLKEIEIFSKITPPQSAPQ